MRKVKLLVVKLIHGKSIGYYRIVEAAEIVTIENGCTEKDSDGKHKGGSSK